MVRAVEFLNPEIPRLLARGEGLRLELGGGKRRTPEFLSLDLVRGTQPDILADLNEPLTLLPDDSVAEVRTKHTLEHVEKLLPLLAELHRVVRPGGLIDVQVPHFSNPYGYSDPTHVRFFGMYSFHYFSAPEDQPRRKVPSFYAAPRFRVESVKVRLMKETWFERAVRTALEPLANRSLGALDRYERRWCRLFPANDIRYLLRPCKEAAGAMPIRQAA